MTSYMTLRVIKVAADGTRTYGKRRTIAPAPRSSGLGTSIAYPPCQCARCRPDLAALRSLRAGMRA